MGQLTYSCFLFVSNSYHKHFLIFVSLRLIRKYLFTFFCASKGLNCVPNVVTSLLLFLSKLPSYCNTIIALIRRVVKSVGTVKQVILSLESSLHTRFLNGSLYLHSPPLPTSLFLPIYVSLSFYLSMSLSPTTYLSFFLPTSLFLPMYVFLPPFSRSKHFWKKNVGKKH